MHAVCVCVGLKSCGVFSCATKHHAIPVKKRVTHDHGGGEKYELLEQSDTENTSSLCLQSELP